MAPTLASSLVISSLGLVSKAFLRAGCKDLKVEGLETLLAALKEPDRKGKGKALNQDAAGLEDDGLESRRGIVTVCNHTSVVDDPLMWGMMPLSTYLPFASPRRTSRNSRWTLGASDIMFTNSVFSKYFALGQVIETVRGGGIFQPAIDDAIQKLQNGEWIHIFPEGRVNQVSLHPEGGLMRFKWGVSRIIMDSVRMPTIIPIWISGFEDVMPDTRKYLRFLPRPGKSVSITIGTPITSKILPLVQEWRDLSSNIPGRLGFGGSWSPSSESESVSHQAGRKLVTEDAETKVKVASVNPERRDRAAGRVGEGREEEVRVRISEVLRAEVLKLGLRVEKREGKDKREWRNTVSRKEMQGL